MKAFRKAGIDLPKVFADATKKGLDPMEAYIGLLDRMTRGVQDPVQKMLLLGKVLHNQQAGTAALSLLQHRDEYIRMRDELHSIGADKMDVDYKTSQEGLTAALAIRAAKVTALEQRIGMGFSWTVPVSSALLGGVIVALNWMDQHLPGVSDSVLGLTGGMLGLVTVMGVLGTVAGPVKAGAKLLQLGRIMKGVFQLGNLSLLVNPWTVLAVAIGASAVYIYQHWDRFQRNFHLLWGGILQMLGGAGEVMRGILDGNTQHVVNGLMHLWNGFMQFMRNLWGAGGIMEKLFGAFADWVDSWTGGLATKLGMGIRTAFDGAKSAIQAAIAAWQDILNNWQPVVRLPDVPIPVPRGAPMTPDGGILPVDPDTPMGDVPRAGLRHPTAYRAPAQAGGGGAGGVPVVRVVFEADVPGRATVDHGPRAERARGPMLRRA